LAVALVALVDWLALAPPGPWERIRDSIPLGASTSLERGLATDQAELARWAGDAKHERRIVVMGSSRANAGFREDWVPEELRDDLTFVKLAHGGVGPFELRVMTEEVLPYRPAAAIFFLSEFDTHYPFSIMPFGLPFRAPAVLDLARHIEGRFFLQHRTRFLRMLAARVSRVYRFREVLQRGWLGEPLRFKLGDPRLGSPPIGAGEWVRRDWRDSTSPAAPTGSEELFNRARAALPDLPERGLHAQVRQIMLIEPGPDLALQENLLWSAFERLRKAGAKVIVVEAPVHPVAGAFVRTEARRNFDEFAKAAKRELGVHVVSLQESGPYRPEDFGDLTHLRGEAGRRLTGHVIREVQRVLEGGE
jgi:hypothetical protein